MGKYKEINYNDIKDHVYYDESSPSFLRWKITRDNISAGDIAGCINSSGYYIVTINNVSYRVHRIIWVLFHKEIDSNLTIDHIDRNRANNNIKNLRLVTLIRRIVVTRVIVCVLMVYLEIFHIILIIVLIVTGVNI